MSLTIKETTFSDPSIEKEDLPFVSIIIPMRNEDAYITDCLESFVKQNYPRNQYEILVIDDHSVDSSIKKVELLANRYPETKIILYENSGDGVADAYRTGIKVAKGTVTLRATAHLIAETNTVTVLVKKLIDLPNLYAGTTCPLYVYPKDKVFSRAAVAFLASSLGGYGTSHYSSKQSGPTREGKAIVALRSNIFDLIGGYPDGDDSELNALLQTAGYKFWLVSDTHVFYRYKYFRLVHHFKRMFSYGESRAQDFKKHAPSRNFIYTLPSILVLSLIFFFAAFFSGNKLIITTTEIALLFYAVIILAFSAYLSVKFQSFAFLMVVPIVIILTYIGYGWGFLKGLFAKTDSFQTSLIIDKK